MLAYFLFTMLLTTLAVTLTVVAAADILLLIGYVTGHYRVLAVCYVLNLLTVPTLAVMGGLALANGKQMGAVVLGVCVGFVACHFILHR